MFAPNNLRACVALLIAAFVCGGCRFTVDGGHSSGSHSVGARTVEYDLDGSGGTASAGDVIVLKFDGGTLDVEKSRIVLDGEEVATFPEDAKVIFVKYAAGKLTVTADGAKIYPAVLAEDPAAANQ